MKIVILTYESYQSNLIIQQVLNNFHDQVVGIIQSENIIPGKSLLQSMLFIFKKTGLIFVVHKGLEIAISRIFGIVARLLRMHLAIPSLQQMAESHGIPLTGTKNVNQSASVEIIRNWKPDLIVSIHFNQLIKKKVIHLAPTGVINIHPALLPKNRGTFPYFWSLVNGDTETGSTVHWIDSKFDTGDIILQEKIKISESDTVTSLANRCARLGADLMVEAITLIQTGNPPRIPQDDTQATYFSWPTPEAARQLKRQKKYGSVLDLWRV
ncbi:MAG TPA: methionyl-tRNA formyltransferase [Sulfurimonas sp.]|nr:methionyl-tRNA formyltransferase [Sulfurimonas sp.]